MINENIRRWTSKTYHSLTRDSRVLLEEQGALQGANTVMNAENDVNDGPGIHEVKCVQSNNCEVVMQHACMVWFMPSGNNRHARRVSRHPRGLAETPNRLHQP